MRRNATPFGPTATDSDADHVFISSKTSKWLAAALAASSPRTLTTIWNLDPSVNGPQWVLSPNMFYNLYSKILVITAVLKYITYAEFLSLISNLKSTLASKALLSPRLSDESSVSAWSDFDAIFRRVTISFLSWSFHFRIIR